MAIKEELEILRGEPIRILTGNPMDIPCIETSDPECLCKHPVVSVDMLTYNHEPYIRQAIEGVVMQKTDFEFELVIGEDCSTDKTREICLEYQKRYPDKIRVLWSDHNLYRNPHSAGGNAERTMAHCRGQFITVCEGDDYWIDPNKLQKQVNYLKVHQNVVVCFCRSRSYNQITGIELTVPPISDEPCIVSGNDFNQYRLRGIVTKALESVTENHYRTLSSMFRKDALLKARKECAEIFTYVMCAGDFRLWAGMSLIGDVGFLPDETGVYRVHPGGVTSSASDKVWFDCQTIRSWFLSVKLKESIPEIITRIDGLSSMLIGRLMAKDSCYQRAYARRVVMMRLDRILFNGVNAFLFFMMRMGLLTGRVRGCCLKISHFIKL